MSTCASLMLSRPFPRPRLRSSSGDQDMKLKVWLELRSLREEDPSFRPELLRLRRMLILFRQRLLMLRNPRLDLLLILMRSLWNMSVSMLLPLLLRREERTLTRFLVSGRQRQLMLLLRLRPLRMKDAIIAQSFSVR